MAIRSKEHATLLTQYEMDSAYSEAYHTLYANIRFDWEKDDHQQHTVLIVSPTAYDEQGSVAANVAIAAAQSGTPTILVDADLRKPTLAQNFGLAESKGLSDLLEEDSVSPRVIAAYLSHTHLPHLRLLSAGIAPNGVQLLSPRLSNVIQSIQQYLVDTESQSSLIIFHSAAVLSGADASVLGTLADQTFLTLRAGKTTRAQAKQAQEQLQRAHTRLTGIIMLGV